MKTITEILNAIEAHAECAIVQELLRMKNEVRQLRPSLCPDDQEHATALLLKLERLVSEQMVVVPDDTALEERFQPAAQAA